MKIKNASLVRNTKFDEKGVQIAGIFARLQYKINRDIKNNTQEVLPLDILRLHVKRDLLYITVATLEEVILDILRFPERFEENNVHVTIRSLIKKIAEKFLAKHYGCEIELSSQFLKRSRYVTSLLNDNELLYTTPLRTLLNPNNATFRSLFSPIYSYASETFIEALLDNLILELSNCVVYLIIVDFGAVYALRQTVYQSRFLSLRNLERFKNNLSWQVQRKNFIQRPLDLYSNRFGLYIIRANGIYYRRVYANRSNEILTLTGFPLLTILFIESKDFLASRFDEIFYSIGYAIRFFFTSALGQVIALIWRGTIEGLKKGK